ncbi:secretory lipase [Rhodococcus sp. OK519]|uniref:alpha/beta fold hydrolase n=1 Tax=Rhodococcus sp. OK519 TaxID=2135729 RepID=UPI000D36485B|nr:secretory lipase [Rhodococcus sp. OK519]
MNNSRTLRATVAALTCCVAATLVLTAAGPAAAAPDFYSPPAQMPATAGDIVHTQPMPIFATLPESNGTWPAAAQLVMYTSRLQDGTPTAVTGTFIDSTHPWRGTGPRPTVVIAPGTSGQGDQCAMSRAFSTGLSAGIDPLFLSANQEAPSAALWSSLGARVFVTDYIGLGTPGVHTYVNRVEQAHAVLDAARAANELGGSGDATPIALWGYSQGGGATAAAAELAASYAPELNIKGTWAGGPTADLEQVLARIDGNLIGGAIGFAVNGFVARYPDLQSVVRERLTPEGQATLDAIGTECIADIIVRRPFLKTGAYTRDGRPLLDNLRDVPDTLQVLRDQRIGAVAPRVPVLITSGRNDDTVPYDQARQLAVDWCERGANVTFRTNELPPILPGTTFGNHFGPQIEDAYVDGEPVRYLLDRLDDVPTAPGCSIT